MPVAASQGTGAGAGTGTQADGAGAPTDPQETTPAGGEGEGTPPKEGEGEGAGSAGKGAEGDGAGEGTPPTEYELTLPDDAALPEAQLERIAAHARERGLNQEQAQSLVVLMDNQQKELLAAHSPGGEEWTRQVEVWKGQTMSDPSLGKDEKEREAAVQRGHRVLQRYAEAHPDRKEAVESFLNDSGLGNHPAMAHLFSWLGQSVKESGLPGGGEGGEGQLSSDERLRAMYPSMAPKE